MSKIKSDRKITWFPKFTTRNIAVMAILAALSYVLYMFVKFPLPFIFPGFLDMQFSDLPALLGGFSLGPIPGALIIAIKCLLKLPATTTAGVGELADLIIGICNVVPAAIFYQFHKSKKGAILALVIGILSSMVAALLANRFILIPFFADKYGMDAVVGMVKALYPDVNSQNFYSYYLPLAALPFNALRSIFCALLTYFTYKPLSRALHWEQQAAKKRGQKDKDSVEKGIYKTQEIDYNNNEIISESEKQTEQIAFEYAKTLKKGDVVLLSGDLGAGKTAFTKGVARYFGLDGVTSPTYAYLNVYGDFIYHYDCYRLSCGEDAERLGLTDYFGGQNICLIEWSENISDVLPKNVKKVKIEKIDKDKRKISL